LRKTLKFHKLCAVKLRRFGFLLILLASLAQAASKDSLLRQVQVYIYRADVFADFPFGALPKNPNVPIPGLWYVRMTAATASLYGYGPLGQWVQSRKIPGLDFTGQTDVFSNDLEQLFPEGFASAVDPRDPWPFKFRLLKLAGTRVDDRSTWALRRLKALEVLMLNSQFTDQGVTALSELRSLRTLGLGGSAVTDKGAMTIKNFFRLERLDLRDTRISDPGVQALMGLPLVELDLGPEVTDKGIVRLAGFPALGQLDLSETKVTGDGLAALSKLPLHTLFLGKSLTDTGMPALAKLKGLRRLDLTGAAITDSGAYQGLRLAGLEELALTRTGVTNALLWRLAALPRLRYLEISGTRITPAGFPALQRSAFLQVLSFSTDVKLTPQDLYPLMKCPRLRTLIINGKILPVEVMEALRAGALKRTSWLLDFLIPDAEAKPASGRQVEKALEVVSLPPVKASVFTGFQESGLVRIHETENALDQVIPSISDPAKVDATTEKNFLGEFTAASGPAKIK
jgi:hypothetical protein